ncbi:phosphopentomutase [Thalassospira sp. MBR-102]|jgi:phosphopentomutase|uniref:phosphopentomutase n=1 Tax=Thalassospira TaxID=168934 RepID=UPI0008DD99C4|nr:MULTISPECIES: phosphopentomutase [Thalassospira]MDM7975388.1 phosphopentomutase [Thalassospira xiamenensis]OHZ00843.1 phosphopentomutase [Thalassospira sp. MIT1004]HBS22005.1 phosphopentomutase [Thalassospira sp.]|tara:strand:- start:3135 stop:4358 length:1224 start_codon:yes stop_codon:yes gene_type:complete
MARAIIIVADSFGIGAAPDAAKFGDQGSDTLGHIAENCANGLADNDIRKGELNIPNMTALGLGEAARDATGRVPPGLEHGGAMIGAYGHAQELSRGKDTPSGHWEIAGVPVDFDWGYFPLEVPTFPRELTDTLIKQAKLPGILGNCHASGTTIIAELGEEHIKTGMPICYTSADSVFQIAAHEEHFGLDRLYKVCEIAFKLVEPYNIGRVIARPFVGSSPADFKRTANRRDIAIPPHRPTLLDKFSEAGGTVISVGKIADIYAQRGISKKVKASGNMALFDAMMTEIDQAPDNSIVFTNLVDFDMEFGHRRDVPGYANALEEFDARIPELRAILKPGDLVIITADHGCDPTWRGNDHTREFVPILAFGPAIQPGPIGMRDSFADIGQTVADHLGIAPLAAGTSFLNG